MAEESEREKEAVKRKEGTGSLLGKKRITWRIRPALLPVKQKEKKKRMLNGAGKKQTSRPSRKDQDKRGSHFNRELMSKGNLSKHGN